MDNSPGEEVSAGQSKADTTEVGQNYICGLPKGKEGFRPLNSGSPFFFAQTALPIMETNIMRGDLYEQAELERKACHLGRLPEVMRYLLHHFDVIRAGVVHRIL